MYLSEDLVWEHRKLSVCVVFWKLLFCLLLSMYMDSPLLASFNYYFWSTSEAVASSLPFSDLVCPSSAVVSRCEEANLEQGVLLELQRWRSVFLFLMELSETIVSEHTKHIYDCFYLISSWVDLKPPYFQLTSFQLLSPSTTNTREAFSKNRLQAARWLRSGFPMSKNSFLSCFISSFEHSGEKSCFGLLFDPLWLYPRLSGRIFEYMHLLAFLK